jgi:transcriptional regulator with XRE-family HTH domain
MDTFKRFASNVRRIRRAQDVTQEELADRAGINATYLSELERAAKGNPTLNVMEGIADALGVPLIDLLS